MEKTYRSARRHFSIPVFLKVWFGDPRGPRDLFKGAPETFSRGSRAQINIQNNIKILREF